MTRNYLPLLLISLFAVSSCQSSNQGPSSRVREFLGAPAVAVLNNPVKVETFRVSSKFQKDGPTTRAGKQIDGYPLLATGKEMDGAFGHRLAAVFFNEKTYDFASAKGCLFDPGVIFRVWNGQQYLDLILCFQCNEFKFRLTDESGKEVRQGGEDFDRSRAT